MYIVARACLIPWSSAEKTLDPLERHQEPEELDSGMKTAHDVVVGFSDNQPSV